MTEGIIATLRLNQKLSQSELAKLCGITQQHMHLIETGQRTPSLKVAAKIATVLNCRIEDLLKEKAG